MLTIGHRISVSALLGLLFVLISPYALAQSGEIGNLCVQDFRSGANCTANDVRIESFVPLNVIENCGDGVEGEAEMVFEALISAAGSPNRFDIGIFIALDGNSARTGDSCLHDYLDPPVDPNPIYGDANSDTIADLNTPPWEDLDGDQCGDILSNTQVLKTLQQIRFSCRDSDSDGQVDLSACASWDNNAGSACNVVSEAFPGTNSKCSCNEIVNTGISVADMSVTKSPATQNVVAGGTATFTISVANTSTVDLTGIIVDDPQCTTLTGPMGDDGDNILEPPETWTYTCTVTNVLADFTNSVTVTATPPFGANLVESDTADVVVIPGADVGVVKSGPASVLAGNQVTYTLLVTNNGPSAADNVVLADPTPAGLGFVSATAPCAGGFPCALGTLANGDSVSVDVTFSVPSGASGSISNTATVTTTTADGNPANDSSTATTTINSAADLSITKADSIDPVIAGNALTYTLTVSNAGPSDALNVSVTDTLPAGVTFVSTTGCAEDPAGVSSCSLGAIAAGGSASYTVSVTVDEATTGTIVNTATVTSSTADPNAANNTAIEPTAINTSADIAVAKSGPATIIAGNQITYTLAVTNNGASTATAVSLADPTPAGLTFVSATAPCAGGFPCALGDLASGASVSVDVTFDVPAGATGTIDNTATVTSPTPDPTPGNNTSTTTTTVNSEADLSITKADDVDPVIAGNALTYTLTVSNAGPSDALNVSVTDTLPAGVTFVSTTGCAEDPNGVPTCTLGAIAAGSSASYSVTVTVDETTTGIITNSATVSSSTTDPNGGNNTATEPTTVNASADVAVVKSGPATVVAGDQVTYTLSVTNNGPSTATSVSLDDPTPAGLTFVSATAPCGGGFPCALGDLASGASLSVDVTFAVPAGATGSIDNTATVTSPTPDPTPGNNTSTTTTTINSDADLSITKTDNIDPVIAGNELTYTLTVSNAGPSDAADVVVTDTLPAGVILISTSGCAEDPTGVPTCNLGAIANGASASFTVTVSVDPAVTGTITNTATVSSSANDPNPGNNNASEPTQVNPLADLTVTKTGPGSILPGEVITYAITVSNLGPSEATSLVIQDPTPLGTVFDSATAPCAGGFPCAVASLAAGDSISFNVSFVVNSPYDGADPLQNTVAVSASTPDPDVSNNSATSTSTVGGLAEADLRIIKSGPPSAAAGSTVTFDLLIENLGPTDASAVTLQDSTPAGATFVSASNGCTEIELNGGTCLIGDLAAGASVTVSITYNVTGAADPIDNTATVSSSTNDPVPGNNTDSASVPLSAIAPVDLAVVKTGPAQAALGADVTYTLTVSNAGPGVATGVILDDPTPAGLSFVSATAPCAAGFPCTLADLAAGASTTVSVTFNIPPGYAGDDPFTNIASVISNEVDTNPANNTDQTDTGLAVAAVDVAVTKTGPASIMPGETLQFTLVIDNNGPGTATGITLQDSTPTGLSFVSASNGCSEAQLNAGSCPVGSLAPGSSTAVTITYSVPPDYLLLGNPDPIENIATVNAAGDSDPSNDTDNALVPLISDADLQVVKSGPATVIAGNQVTYTLAVTNNGPSAAQNVSLDDPTPAGLTFVSATAPCAAGFPCALGNLASGASVSVDVTYQVPADATGTIVNTAMVSSPTPDPVPGNNDSTVTTTIGAEADLSITKVDDVDPVVAGNALTYTLTVSNAGPSDAQNVSVTDTLPTGVTFVSTSGCAEDPNGLSTCTLGTIVAGGSASYTVSVTVDEATTGTIINSATVTSSTTDPNAANNTAIEPTTVDASADVAVVKSGPATVVAGNQVTYTLAVTNNGPSTATAVSLDDPTPAGLTFVSATAPCAAGFPCALGDLASGASVSVDVTFAVPANATGTINNTATVTSPTPDPIPGNNSSTASTTVGGEADLSIVKVDDIDPVIAGNTLTYTLTVNNAGPSDAQNVSVIDTLPAGVTFVSTTGCAEDPNGLPTCTLGTIVAGGSASYSVTVSVDATTTGTITNTATVSSSTTDPNGGNNTATEPTTVNASADVAVVKSGPATVIAGNQITYTLAVVNNGPSAAASVLLDDPTPAGLTLISATVPCAGGFPCALGNLAAGAMVSVDVTFQVPANASGPIVNTATVSSPTPDPVPGNNSSTVTTTVGGEADLSITKVDDVDPVIAGNALTYTLTVNNAGPSDAQNVSVVDTLPAGVTFVSTTGCAEDPNGLPTCSLGTIAAGGSASYSVAVTVDAATVGSIINSATVSSSTTDPNGGNNTATEPTTVNASADVAVVKSGPATVIAGNQITYNLAVTNNGASTATAVSLDDPTPAGLVFVSATAPCAGGFPCALGDLTIGASVSVNVIFSVPADASGTITNTATATSPTPDPVPGNNSSTVSTTIGAEADLSIVKVDDVDPVIAGNALTYTLTVNNAGPSDAQNVSVTDTLPPGVTFVSTTGCAEDPNGLPTCSLGTIVAGGSASYTVSVTVDEATTGTITNTAVVTSTTTDPDGGNNTATEPTTVNASADVAVVKTGPATVIAGNQITYTLLVSNNGPSTATAVSLDDPTPAGVTFVSATAPCAGGFPCALGDLAVGASVSVDVTFDVAASATGSIVNIATASSPTPDPDTGNNSSTVSTTIEAQADLAVVKTGPATVVAGSQIVYTLAVTNNGPSDAIAVSLDDPTPVGVTFVSATAPCAGGFPCALGDLAVGASVTVDVTFDVPADASGTIDNTATVTSTTPDPDNSNNSSSVSTTINAEADVQVVKSGPATVQPGNQLTYTLAVTNNGPSDAIAVSLDDPTPVGVTFVSATAPCAGGFPCALGDLAVGASVSVDVTFDVPLAATGDIVNVATVTSTTPDPDPSNNSSTVTTTIGDQADVQVVKSGPATAIAGTQVTYTLVVTNNGPGDALAVSLDDPTPAGVSFVSATAPCTGGFPCALGDLANAASISVDVTFQIPPDFAGDITNTATVSSTTPDADPANNSSTAVTTVGAQADVAVVKSVDIATPPFGGAVTFTIVVTNNGPSTAVNVVAADPLPTGFILVSATADTGTYDTGTGDWTIGDLLPTATASLSIVATVNNSGDYLNVVNVSATTPDPDTSNNQSSAGVTPAENPVIGVAKEVTNVVVLGPDAIAVDFSIVVENLGDVDLANVQVDEDLTATFPAPSNFSVTALSSGSFTVNPGFDGFIDTGLLSGGDSLLIGQAGAIQLTVEVTLNGQTGPFENIVIATGVSPIGAPVSDPSDNGVDPDPDDSGDPGDPDENDPTPIVFTLPPPVIAVPTLDHFGLALMALLMLLGAATQRRRWR
ncbi:MAG: hypothetical protein Tsb002_08100 [Wenzhouxiangellaceae bacterium]